MMIFNNNLAPSRALIWSRAMFDKSTDHGNDAIVAQFSCRVRISKKRQRKRTSKTVVKKTNRQQFSMVCALMDHRNDFQMLKALQWNHEPQLSFEQCDVISIGNCCQFVKMIMIMVLIVAMITMMMIMIVMVMYIVEWCNDDDDDDDNNGGGSGDEVGLDVLDMVIMTVGAINFGDVMMRMTIDLDHFKFQRLVTKYRSLRMETIQMTSMATTVKCNSWYTYQEIHWKQFGTEVFNFLAFRSRPVLQVAKDKMALTLPGWENIQVRLCILSFASVTRLNIVSRQW